MPPKALPDCYLIYYSILIKMTDSRLNLSDDSSLEDEGGESRYCCGQTYSSVGSYNRHLASHRMSVSFRCLGAGCTVFRGRVDNIRTHVAKCALFGEGDERRYMREGTAGETVLTPVEFVLHGTKWMAKLVTPQGVSLVDSRKMPLPSPAPKPRVSRSKKARVEPSMPLLNDAMPSTSAAANSAATVSDLLTCNFCCVLMTREAWTDHLAQCCGTFLARTFTREECKAHTCKALGIFKDIKSKESN